MNLQSTSLPFVALDIMSHSAESFVESQWTCPLGDFRCFPFGVIGDALYSPEEDLQNHVEERANEQRQ